MRRGFMIGAVLVGIVTACSSSSSENPGSSGGGTCASTCAKSIALGCTSGEHDQAACEASCAKQQSSCASAGMTTTFQTYLDCIEAHPMECGSATGSPSSPDCLQQGLAIFACAAGSGGSGGGGSGGSSGGTGMTGDPCAHDSDCLGYRRCKSGACAGVTSCTNDGSCGALGKCYSDPQAGQMCWVACSDDSQCLASGYVDWTKCTNGWCAKP